MSKEQDEALIAYRQACRELQAAAAKIREAHEAYNRVHELWTNAEARARKLGAI